jgi:hypothetical protein
MTELYHVTQTSLFTLTRACLTCGIEKSLETDFDKQKTGKYGYRAHCKKCRWETEKTKERQEWVEVTSKICPRCDPPTEKPIDDFPLNKRSRDKHGSYCKACQRKWANSEEEKARQRAIRKEKRRDPAYNQTVRARQNAWRKKHPECQQELTMRRNTRKKAATTERVSYKRILTRDGYYCYICNQSIDPHAKPRSQESLTFDHVIPIQPRPSEPQGTHCESNIRPAHKVCNARKSNKPLETLTDIDRQGPSL